MPAYILAKVAVNDPEAYAEYAKRSGPAVAAHGGEFLVRGSDPIVLEGESDGLRTVIVRFPDIESAQAFYNSQAYNEARTFRAPPVADGTFLLFDDD